MRIGQFMASPVGRGGRIVIGAALIAGGIGGLGGVAGWAMAVAGLLPLTLGVIDGCILAPVLHIPFKGSALRALQAEWVSNFHESRWDEAEALFAGVYGYRHAHRQQVLVCAPRTGDRLLRLDNQNR